jgi:hypothetical protein
VTDTDFPPLRPDAELRVCLTCGAVVPVKGVEFHRMWHDAAASAAIEALRRLDAGRL